MLAALVILSKVAAWAEVDSLPSRMQGERRRGGGCGDVSSRLSGWGGRAFVGGSCAVLAGPAAGGSLLGRSAAHDGHTYATRTANVASPDVATARKRRSRGSICSLAGAPVNAKATSRTMSTLQPASTTRLPRRPTRRSRTRTSGGAATLKDNSTSLAGGRTPYWDPRRGRAFDSMAVPITLLPVRDPGEGGTVVSVG